MPSTLHSRHPHSSSNGQPDPASAAESDERDFAAFSRTQDPLDIQAATWVTRNRNGLDARGEAELQAWLDADPCHAEAFEDMAATLGDLQQLSSDEVARLKAGLPDRERTAVTPPSPRLTGVLNLSTPMRRGFRVFLPQTAAAAIALILAGSGWMGWDHWRRQPVFEQTYATARGQQLTAKLPDADEPSGSNGSTLQLDTATHAQIRLYRDRREVRLQEGQAMFTVRSDAQRPFYVYAGSLRITVTGTRFSVRHSGTGLDAGRTVVSVEEGRVRVAAADHGATEAGMPAADVTVELSAGQTATADAQGRLGPVASLPPGDIAPWRDGRLNFDQTPLAQAIAEFERYGHTGLVVRDPAVATLPVGGSYSPRQHQQFARALPQLLPVRLVRRGSLTEVVAQPR